MIDPVAGDEFVCDLFEQSGKTGLIIGFEDRARHVLPQHRAQALGHGAGGVAPVNRPWMLLVGAIAVRFVGEDDGQLARRHVEARVSRSTQPAPRTAQDQYQLPTALRALEIVQCCVGKVTSIGRDQGSRNLPVQGLPHDRTRENHDALPRKALRDPAGRCPHTLYSIRESSMLFVESVIPGPKLLEIR